MDISVFAQRCINESHKALEIEMNFAIEALERVKAGLTESDTVLVDNEIDEELDRAYYAFRRIDQLRSEISAMLYLLYEVTPDPRPEDLS